MVRILGHTDRGLLHTTSTLTTPTETGRINFTSTEFHSSSSDKKNSQNVEKRFDLSTAGLVKNDNDFKFQQYDHNYYTTSLLLIKTDENSDEEILEKAEIVKEKSSELRAYFLPRCTKIRQQCEETELDTTEEDEDTSNYFSSTCRILIAALEDSAVLYDVESQIFTGEKEISAKLEILSSELIAKSFWFSQWLPHQEAFAFAHFRTPIHSSFDDDDVDQSAKECAPKPFLSIVQFHKSFPRESVLNMPLLDLYLYCNNSTTCQDHGDIKLVYDPNVLSSSPSNQLKLLAHPSGAVYLFHVVSTSLLKYSVNMLHHNKTLDVDMKLELNAKTELVLDVGLYSKDQYLMVVGWPYFIHFLDGHHLSHHLIFDFDSFLGLQSQVPFLCLFNPRFDNANEKFFISCDEKTDLSPKYSTTSNLVFNDVSHSCIELNSSLLLPLMENSSIQFKLAVLHHFLVHVEDINVSKRIIYDEGKQRGNLFLKHIYQEFLIGHAYLQTKKQILPNMDSFLYLIPYSADPDTNRLNTELLKMEIQDTKRTDVSIMLLSPSQRVFPHNVTDLWTSLWHLNRNYSKSKRFCHKGISEKLILSLQCYKPEALSRASTPGPMSPSSPMICTSLGEIVGMFGRRATTELQLPFVEYERCTANKQEYIFSINLREMSMHLLKERKEYPLHGHAVAGKYVCALGDTARLLCHLLCLTVHLQPTKNKDKGFNLIDVLEWDVRLKLFMLMEHYTLALTTLAAPHPVGFIPFFAYLGYRVLKFDQFLWHVKAGTFDLQIDLVKIIMADIKEDKDENITKKMQLLSLLPKTRANRILNSWPHKISVSLRARQHASDLLSGSVSQNRKRMMTPVGEKKKKSDNFTSQKDKLNALDTFYNYLGAKANPSDLDLGLLTEATLISMEDMKV